MGCGRCFTWNRVEQLQAVGEMALPDCVEGRRGDEILLLVLRAEQLGEALEPRDSG